jgi:hypothetical protein
VPNIENFIDSRMKPSLHLTSRQLKNQALKKDSMKQIDGYNYDYGMYEPWTDRNDLVKDMFDPKSFKKPIDIYYFDLPGLQLNSQIGQ